jgi:hypothetical protein
MLNKINTPALKQKNALTKKETEKCLDCIWTSLKSDPFYFSNAVLYHNMILKYTLNKIYCSVQTRY